MYVINKLSLIRRILLVLYFVFLLFHFRCDLICDIFINKIKVNRILHAIDLFGNIIESCYCYVYFYLYYI